MRYWNVRFGTNTSYVMIGSHNTSCDSTCQHWSNNTCISTKTSLPKQLTSKFLCWVGHYAVQQRTAAIIIIMNICICYIPISKGFVIQKPVKGDTVFKFNVLNLKMASQWHDLTVLFLSSKTKLLICFEGHRLHTTLGNKLEYRFSSFCWLTDLAQH